MVSPPPTEINKEWYALQDAVRSAQGILAVPVSRLRDLTNAGRLGQQVIANISTNLSALGIGHLPLEIPNRQNHTVVLLDNGSPAAAVIRYLYSVFSTNTVEDSEAAMDLLRQINVPSRATVDDIRNELQADRDKALKAVEDLFARNFDYVAPENQTV